MITSSQRQLFINKGYGIIDDVYSISEMSLISNCISDYSKSINHKDNKDLFAIRQLLNVIPELIIDCKVGILGLVVPKL